MRVAHIDGMKLLVTAVLVSVPFCAMAATPQKPAPAASKPAAEAAGPATPGFWERAWTSTKKGTKSIVDGTKRVGSKTADVVTSPFSGDKKPGETKPWRSLAMSMSTAPEHVKLSEDRSVKVTVTVVNTGKFAAQLDFPTTQRIEVVVKSEGGKEISKWSDDQRVDKEQGFLVINPDERLEYTATISTRNMAAGHSYVIEAFFPSFDQLRTRRVVSPVK